MKPNPNHDFLDLHIGRGSLVVAGTAGYSVGNLNIPGYPLAWEEHYKDWKYPLKFASPLQIEIEASNGASDYGIISSLLLGFGFDSSVDLDLDSFGLCACDRQQVWRARHCRLHPFIWHAFA